MKAKQLEDAGKITEAFDIYVQLEHSQNAFVSKQAQLHLQKIYLDFAKKQEALNPEKAISLYQKMVERWPTETIAELAKKKISRLEKPPEPPKPTPEELFCIKATKAKSRIIWQQYKQKFPTGSCIAEAEIFLNNTLPNAEERETTQNLSVSARNGLKLACEEYNLAKTTGDSSACSHPNKAFSNELQRLIRRKTTLLSEGNKEYYQNFIPKRWNAVKSGINSSCQNVQDYLEDRASQGIDRYSLEEIIKNTASICLEDIGDISDI